MLASAMALLRPSELARMWELHPKTVYLWIREGKLPAIKTPGAQYRVRTDDARAYCEKNGLPMPRAIASHAPDVVAIDAECGDVKVTDAIRALRKTARTAGVPVVVYDLAPRAGTTALSKLGASSVIARG